MRERLKLQPSILGAMSETPLVELRRITDALDGTIFAKLDYLLPGASKKDRIARQIIEEAEQEGLLAKGQPVVELTSGNAGTGLAIVCAVKRYPFVAVMSRGNSPERARMMAALGAEVVLVDQADPSAPGQVSGDDLVLVEVEAQRLTTERGAFRVDQFHHRANSRAHYLHTGPEIWEQSGDRVDAFCDFVGSGGTFTGCAASLKNRNPNVRCFVVEPRDAAVLAGGDLVDARHRIQGGGYAMSELRLLDRNLIDGFLTVTDDEVTHAARRLARVEGIFAGYSTGANLAAAIQLLEGECHGQSIAIIAGDSGLKYMSTELWP